MKHYSKARQPFSHPKETFHFDNRHLRLIDEPARGLTGLMTYGTGLITGAPITAGINAQTS